MKDCGIGGASTWGVMGAGKREHFSATHASHASIIYGVPHHRNLAPLKDMRKIINNQVVNGLHWMDVEVDSRVVGQRLSVKQMHEKVL